MEVKIGKAEGYNIYYSSTFKNFILKDDDGAELASAKTAEEIEAKAKQLRKQDFKRIRIIYVSRYEGKVNEGELTSINRDDQSAWVSLKEKATTWGGNRTKIRLHYDTGYYEATEGNLGIAEVIKEKRRAIDGIFKEIEQLVATLEKPINLEYFGIVRVR